MQETPRYKLPFPEHAEANDVPEHMKQLAMAVENLVAMPVGAFMPTFNVTAPVNWLLMKGQTVMRSSWPLLADLWGIPANVLSFVVPDMSRVTLMGAGPGDSLGAVDGSNSKVLTVAQLPPHGHAFTPNQIQLIDPGHRHLIDVAGSSLVISPPGEQQNYMPNKYLQPPNPAVNFIQTTMTQPSLATTGVTVDQSTTGGTVQNTGSGQAVDITPKHIKVNFMVRAA